MKNSIPATAADLVRAANMLTSKGIHYGIKWKRRELLVEFKHGCDDPSKLPMTRAGRMYRTGLALKELMKETNSSTEKEAVEKLLAKWPVYNDVQEKKLPQPLPDEMGRRSEPSPAIANPIGLLIRIL